MGSGWASGERLGKGEGTLCSLCCFRAWEALHPLTHLTSITLTAGPGRASLPVAPVSGEAGQLPRDMPTHGSPAAKRQANARVRPRAAVSGPAHRPHPAQPSAPAPAGDPALGSLAGLLSMYHPPSTFGDRHLVLQSPPSAPHTKVATEKDLHKHQSDHISGLYICCPQHPARPCAPHPLCCHACHSLPLQGLSLEQLASAPGLGTVVPSGSLLG